MRQAMETNTRLQNMDAQQRESALQMQLKFAPIGAYIVGPIAIVVVALIMAGVLLMVCKMMGASLTFKQMFGISAYAMLPGLIASILTIIVIFTQNPENFNLQNPIAPDDGRGWLRKHNPQPTPGFGAGGSPAVFVTTSSHRPRLKAWVAVKRIGS